MNLKESFIRIFSSYKASIILMLIYALILAVATFVEKYTSTEIAKVWIYYSPIFIFLQFLLVINFILISIKNHLFEKKKWGGIFVHISLIVILIGAFVTHVSGEEGTIHIREGEAINHMVIHSNKGTKRQNLPFSLKLEKFTLVRYPGSSSPSSYESLLTIHVDGKFEEKRISMNNVLDIKGYRLFQSSYDKDEKGTILSANKDVAGRIITYGGYFFLIIGFILSFINKKSRFRQLVIMLKQTKTVSAILAIILCCTHLSIMAQDSDKNIFEVIQKNKVDEGHAALFGSLPMQSTEGRIKPINTFSSEVLRKLYHSDRIGELNSDQFLLSLLTLPEMWMHVPFITYKSDNISFNYDISEKQCAYAELFDTNGNYKLQEDLEKAFSKPLSNRSKFDKDLIKLDEQINIFHQLMGHKMIKIFPDKNDSNHTWYAYGEDLSSLSPEDRLSINQIMNQYLESVREGMRSGDWEKANSVISSILELQKRNNTAINLSSDKLEAELLYNDLNIFQTCKKIYLILGGVMLVLSFVNIFRRYTWIDMLIKILLISVFLGVIYHVAGIAMRWYISGYAPWSNAYETMIYVSAITVIAGLIFARQSQLTVSLATLFAGVILFVSGLNWMNPQISPLVPVLKSPWLMIHVAVIVAAYGFFGISFLLGGTNLILLRINKKKNTLILKNRIQELCVINEMSLWAGLALMTIGTFLGAIWANESWGRYWGWDPKETWALVTVIVYAVVAHLRLVKKWDNPYIFNLLSVIAFACVLMTYFGVNYYLSGMHSYA